MSQQIQFTQGEHYHLYNRGRSKLAIFHEKANYIFAIKKLSRYSKQFNIKIIAYCLLPNHYHFLVRQDDQHRAGLLPQRVFNSYSKAYNKRFDHSGTIFEGRYKAIHVDTDVYAAQLCQYIHLNPVKHGLVQHPDQWPWSNWLDVTRKRNGELQDTMFISSIFGSTHHYKTSVLKALNTQNWEANV